MRSWSVQDVAEAIDVKLAAERRARVRRALESFLSALAGGVLLAGATLGVALLRWWWP